MSILSNIFGGGGGKKNPMDEANNYFNQIPRVAHQGYDPYIDQGQDASGKTKTAYERLMEDPTGFINELMKNYQTSEGYGVAKDELTKTYGNTAAAGGIAGTPLDQQNQAQGVQGLLSKDMQQFLENALGVYGKGLAGEEGIATRGYDASGKLTDILGSNLNQQGSAAFQNAQQQNKDRNSWYQSLAKALGVGAGAVFGGATGGLPGAAAGAKAGGKIGNSIFG